MEASKHTVLQVQIAAFGQEGIDRVAAHQHPQIEGVRWLVSLQMPEGEVRIPDALAVRQDFDIIIHRDKGLARNRNHALDFPSDSGIVLIADDDIDYSAEGLLALIQAFADYPEADIICCRYLNNGQYVKNYGDGTVFSLKKPPFGWYVSSIEMAFRREVVGSLRFNENTGIGSGKLIAGEDSIFFVDLLRQGANGICAPIDIGSHNHDTTGERLQTDPEFLKSHGACLTHIKPVTWFPRLLLHARRNSLPFFSCLRHTLAGAVYALIHRPFKNQVKN